MNWIHYLLVANAWKWTLAKYTISATSYRAVKEFTNCHFVGIAWHCFPRGEDVVLKRSHGKIDFWRRGKGVLKKEKQKKEGETNQIWKLSAHKAKLEARVSLRETKDYNGRCCQLDKEYK